MFQRPHFLLFLTNKCLPCHGQIGASKPLSEAKGLVEDAQMSHWDYGKVTDSLWTSVPLLIK